MRVDCRLLVCDDVVDWLSVWRSPQHPLAAVSLHQCLSLCLHRPSNRCKSCIPWIMPFITNLSSIHHKLHLVWAKMEWHPSYQIFLKFLSSVTFSWDKYSAAGCLTTDRNIYVVFHSLIQSLPQCLPLTTFIPHKPTHVFILRLVVTYEELGVLKNRWSSVVFL